jgi:hypothetical protein
MTATISDYVLSTISSAVNWAGLIGRDGDKWLSIVTGTTCSEWASSLPFLPLITPSLCPS